MDSLLSVSGLKKVFSNGAGIKDVSIHVGSGEIHAILGENGAGKSTAILCTLDIMKRDAGIVKLGEVEYPRGDWRIRRHIGYAPELPALPAYLTAMECLVSYGLMRGIRKSILNSEASELLDLVGLSESASLRVSRFSRGMLARLDIAICLLGKPDVLVLDEPTAGLDPVSKRDLIRTMKALASEEQTIIISSHQLGDVQKLCSSATIIHQGRTIFEAEVSDIMKKKRRNVTVTTKFDGVDNALIRSVSQLDGVLSVKGGETENSLDVSADSMMDIGRIIAETALRAGHVMTGIIERENDLEDAFVRILEGGSD